MECMRLIHMPKACPYYWAVMSGRLDVPRGRRGLGFGGGVVGEGGAEVGEEHGAQFGG